MREFGGTWSEAKLDCVEKYACVYLQVMQKQTWCTLEYVDAFAGRGKQALRSGMVAGDVEAFFGDESERADTEEFLVGSAIRALRASATSTRCFDRFHFIDADQPSCDELETVVHDEFPSLAPSVQITCDDANTTLRSYVDSTDWSTTRGLVFLDPYGLEVDWDLIQKLAGTGACDVWYLFPLGGVLRMMTSNGQIPDAWSDRLDRLFGTRGWHDEFYKLTPETTLFGEDERMLRDASTKHVVDYVRGRLSTVFPAVSKAAILRNSKGAPLFALILCIANPRKAAQSAALRIADYLVKDLSQ